ncbi:MAG: hypothetical protein KF726_17960 [Anaerolineae bacterium]|nr:hypothetical protein [Anaerolineae bacterium]
MSIPASLRRHLRLGLIMLLVTASWQATALITVHAQAAPSSRWQQIVTENAPAPRHDHVLIAAGESGKLMLFGGRTNNGTIYDDTWLFDVNVNAWREIMTAVAPQARFGAAAAWDTTRERILLFAGQASGLFNDVWSFDLATETWTRLETQGTAPIARYGTSAVFDPQLDRLIISHGFAAGRFDDTFALDLKTSLWSDISPTIRPLKRCLHEAAYATSTGTMILFGGCSSGFGPCPQGDTWSFDLDSGVWTELQTQGDSPAARSNPALMADSAGRVWLYGGRGAGGIFYGDLWRLDPLTGSWQLSESASDSAPRPRSSHDAAWDSVRQQIVLFGGLGETGDLNDLWVYQATASEQ